MFARFHLTDDVEFQGNKYRVSTVELPFFFDDRPYETMIFGYNPDGSPNSRDLFCQRYTNKYEAQQEHEHILAVLRGQVIDEETFIHLALPAPVSEEEEEA